MTKPPTSQQVFSCQTNINYDHQSTLGCESKLPAQPWVLNPVTLEASGSTNVTFLSSTKGAINAYGVLIRHGAADTKRRPWDLARALLLGLEPCTLAALAITSAVTILILRGRRQRRRRDQQEEQNMQQQSSEVNLQPAESSRSSIMNGQRSHNGGQQQYELDAIRDPSELPVRLNETLKYRVA
ncbi:hypothetical protein PG987_007465 [Apiospora arundinis]